MKLLPFFKCFMGSIPDEHVEYMLWLCKAFCLVCQVTVSPNCSQDGGSCCASYRFVLLIECSFFASCGEKLCLDGNFNLKWQVSDIKRCCKERAAALCSIFNQSTKVIWNCFSDQTSAGFSWWKDLSFVISHDGKFWVLSSGVFTWSNLSDHHAVHSRSPAPLPGMFSDRWIIRLCNKTLRNGVFILAPEQDYQPHTEMVDKL